MAGEEAYLNYFLWGTWICLITYILYMGKNGWLIFKINLPFKKRAGTWYIKLMSTGRIDINYGRFKTKQVWSDKSETQITHVFDRTNHTREPLICLVEGYSLNIPLSALVEEFPKDAKEVTTWLKTVYATGIERTGLEDEKKKDLLFWVQTMMPILLVAVGLGILYVYFQVAEGNTILKDILETIKTLKPTIIGPGAG